MRGFDRSCWDSLSAFRNLASAEDNLASAEDGWVSASSTPFQTGLAAGWSQLFKKDVPVHGLRINGLYGVQSEVVGVDIGLFNDADTLTGVGLGVCNFTRGSARGAHLGVGCNQADDDFDGVQTGLANLIGGDLTGLQIGVASSSAGAGTGVQLGLVSQAGALKGLQAGALLNVARGNSVGAQLGVVCAVATGDFKGLQMGTGNFVTGELTGAQLGALNTADRGTGFQLGVVNYAKSTSGVQIGLLNFNENGFLPAFPIFNYGK